MKRDFLRFFDLKENEVEKLVKRGLKLKLERSKNCNTLKSKSVALIFEKSSTRTRVSFEVAINELGGTAIVLNSKDMQMGRGELIEDTAKVLSSYVNAIVYRCYSHKMLEKLAKHSSIPVINGLSDLTHPVQVLSDFLTVYEHFGSYKNLNYAWVGDGNNMANSWIEAHLLLGINLVMACPKGFEPDKQLLKLATKNKNFKLVTNPEDAVKNADVVSTDVWVSMGDEDEAVLRKKAFKKYIITRKLMQKANKSAIVLHCLPAHRGEEIEAEIIDDPKSVIFKQAENRLHAQKSLLEMLIK